MKTFRTKAVMENVSKTMEFIVETVENQITLTQKNKNDIMILCEEVIMNIVSYAYTDGKGDMTVECSVDSDNKEITLIFKDNGIEFNPFKKEDPDINLNIMEREIGGLGIFMIKQIADKYSYDRVNGDNILTLVKSVKEADE